MGHVFPTLTSAEAVGKLESTERRKHSWQVPVNLVIISITDKIVATVGFKILCQSFRNCCAVFKPLISLHTNGSGLPGSDFMPHWYLKQQLCQPYSFKPKQSKHIPLISFLGFWSNVLSCQWFTPMKVGGGLFLDQEAMRQTALSHGHAGKLHWRALATGTFPQHGAVYRIRHKTFPCQHKTLIEPPAYRLCFMYDSLGETRASTKSRGRRFYINGRPETTFVMTESTAFPKQITQSKLPLTSKPAEPVAREPMVTVVEGSSERRLTLCVTTDLHSALCVYLSACV